jgi:hypothetical protein
LERWQAIAYAEELRTTDELTTDREPPLADDTRVRIAVRMRRDADGGRARAVDTLALTIRSDSYTTLLDATRRCGSAGMRGHLLPLAAPVRQPGLSS